MYTTDILYHLLFLLFFIKYIFNDFINFQILNQPKIYLIIHQNLPKSAVSIYTFSSHFFNYLKLNSYGFVIHGSPDILEEYLTTHTGFSLLLS